MMVTGIVIDRVSGGKIAEHWVNRDDLGLMQQIDAKAKPGEQARMRPGKPDCGNSLTTYFGE